jgi:hypothetical protein
MATKRKQKRKSTRKSEPSVTKADLNRRLLSIESLMAQNVDALQSVLAGIQSILDRLELAQDAALKVLAAPDPVPGLAEGIPANFDEFMRRLPMVASILNPEKAEKARAWNEAQAAAQTPSPVEPAPATDSTPATVAGEGDVP